jgi:hypothetical protein
MTPGRFVGAALLVVSVATVLGCADASPVGVGVPTPAFQTSSTRPGLLYCPQKYDSVSKVIGPNGGSLNVGPHVLWVGKNVLSDTVTITAVAPKDTVRWVRFQPEGLQFPAHGSGVWSAGAVLMLSYKNCGQIPDGSLRIAQVDDSLRIIEYLQSISSGKNNPWSNGSQWVFAALRHFSSYAVSY